MIKEFTSQVKAQEYVKSLVRKGFEPGLDFKLYTKPNGTYCVEVYRKLGIFGA